jgi:chromosome segregation ATPase
MEKQAYQKKMESQIREWDSEIDALRKKIKSSSEKTARYEKELEQLQEKRHAVRSKFDDLKEAADDAWEDVREGLDKAWDDMRRAGTVLTSYFKK